MKKYCPLLPARPALIAAGALASLLTVASHLNAQRLADRVIPEHCALTLTPDLKAATFSGAETIDVTLKAPAKAITLNAAEIEFQSITVMARGKVQTASVTLDKRKEQVTFSFPEEIPSGRATLVIHFTGVLNNELRGFYLSRTARRNYAVTQFEPTDARRAFPSFDEPAFKATYDISLVVDAGDSALSNSPIASDTPGPIEGKHTVRFQATPKMSSYLVAFLVGDFQCTSGDQDGVDIRVCAIPEKVSLTPYGLDVAKFMLHYFNNYFGIPYPLKKLDLIAVPDFEAGAMENFGAITYRETDLLVDPATASIGTKKEVALVIAHEIAHQWFGDLVTMQWWDNIWLNEGFATWMENKSVQAMHPEWNIEQTVASDLNGTLNLDAQPTTRAIRARAETPDEINQLFDGIAYGKAGHVLFAIENYIGREAFREGVHNYLSEHLYANATAEDFWNAETAASHKPVNRVMDSIISQPGVPLLTFADPYGGQVNISQQRFYLSPSVRSDVREKWTIPVCFRTEGDSQRCEVLTPTATGLKVHTSAPLFANAGGTGYYRSAYSASAYKALVSQVESRLTAAERISLIGDEWAQLRANKVSVGEFLDLAAAIKDDSNTEVISAAFNGVAAIYDRIAATPAEKSALALWIRRNFGPEYARLGEPSASDSASTRELRARLFAILGNYGNDPAVHAQARQIAEKYVSNPSSIDPTLGETALDVAARSGDAAFFNQLQTIFETSANPELQDNALRTLARFEAPSLVQRSLDYTLSGKVRNQDAAIQFSIALAGAETREQAWKYIQDHWEKVRAQLTTDMGSYLISSTGNFCTVEARDSVKAFFSAHTVSAADVSLKHALEGINGCIELRSLQEPKFRSWLATQADRSAVESRTTSGR
jgi:aminopeptidase N/puromycin-sensitive aminopeptidase